jgi:hypothetical protein
MREKIFVVGEEKREKKNFFFQNYEVIKLYLLCSESFRVEIVTDLPLGSNRLYTISLSNGDIKKGCKEQNYFLHGSRIFIVELHLFMINVAENGKVFCTFPRKRNKKLFFSL